MASYGVGKFIAEFLTGAFGSIVFKFYETEIGLDAGYVALATIIYSLWNAINDPLLGFLTNKGAPFHKRFGRRVPWIVIGLILSASSFLLIFTVPFKSNQILIFLWMVFTISLFDGAYTLWEVNYQSLFPDKFRTQNERTSAASYATAIGILGITAGFILPPMFFNYGDIPSFIVNGYVSFAVVIVALMLLLHGIRESKLMKERFIKQQDFVKENKKEFTLLAQVKKLIKNRNLMGFLVLMFFYQSATMSMTSSVHYVGDYVLQTSSSGVTIIFAGMLLGTLISIPFWLLIVKKLKNNQLMLIITSILMSIFAFIMFFNNTKMGYTIFMGLWGIGFGGFWTYMSPAMGDIIDEIVVKERAREDGLVMGIRAFFMRLSYVTQAVSFWLIHKMTNFSVDPTSTQSKIGIKVHMALLPSILFIIGTLLFIKINTLNGKKAKENKDILASLDI